MRLSEQEMAVVSSLELRAELPIKNVRKETGLRDHSIRYALGKLEQREIARKVPVINVQRMGYAMHNIYFSLSSDNKHLKSKINFVIF